jgi:DNA replication protein DnaC
MDNYQTIEKLRQMRLSAMAELHLQHIKNNKSNDATPDEYLALLTEHEWDSRQNQKVNRLIKQAGFKQKADIAGVDYTAPRNLDKNMFNRLATLDFIKRKENIIITGASGVGKSKNMFNRLATLDFIKRKENIIITGASGVGKSYLAQAIGHHACVTGDRVIYTNTARLFTRLKLSKTDGTYIKELIKLQKVNLLILDDFGLQAFDNMSREMLMDIIDDRYNKMSTIISSQIPVSVWYDIIGEGTIADAILDRIVNSSHRINLKGESMRKGILKTES